MTLNSRGILNRLFATPFRNSVSARVASVTILIGFFGGNSGTGTLLRALLKSCSNLFLFGPGITPPRYARTHVVRELRLPLLTFILRLCYDYIMPDKEITRPSIEREKLWKYLPHAISRIVEAIDSPNEKIALGAARYIADQCIGKPTSTGDDGEDKFSLGAAAMVKALTTAKAELAAAPETQEPIIEGTVRILGSPVPETPTNGLLNSDDAMAEIDAF